jgi:hypothetical protein
MKKWEMNLNKMVYQSLNSTDQIQEIKNHHSNKLIILMIKEELMLAILMTIACWGRWKKNLEVWILVKSKTQTEKLEL